MITFFLRIYKDNGFTEINLLTRSTTPATDAMTTSS